MRDRFLLPAATALAPVLSRHRRTLHREPELAFAEERTAAYIERQLDRLGIPHRRVVGTCRTRSRRPSCRCTSTRTSRPVSWACGRVP